MLIEKGLVNSKGIRLTDSRYTCDMCRVLMTKKQRILIYKSDAGGDIPRKKWDVCERCMKILEKNVNLWYDKIVSKK